MNFEIRQEKFEGPLELLVELIESEKVSISEISLARVTDDYVHYVKSLGKIDPETLAEFLVVAAQLMLVKSRSLLPGLELSEEDEESIGELEKRLEEYRTYHNIAKKLKELEKDGRRIMTREHYQGMEPIFYPPPSLTREVLAHAFTVFLASLPKIEKIAKDTIRRIVSLEERINHIRTYIESAVEKSFSELTKNASEKIDVIISFLAILELTKQKCIELDQNDLFGDIVMKRKENNNEGSP